VQVERAGSSCVCERDGLSELQAAIAVSASCSVSFRRVLETSLQKVNKPCLRAKQIL